MFTVLFLLSTPEASFAYGNNHGREGSRSIIKKIISAYGGPNAIRNIKTVHAAGFVAAFMRQDWGSYELYFKRPRKLRVETNYRHSSETRILNGDQGYRGTDQEPLSQVRDYRFFAMLYQCKHFDLPYGLLSGVYRISIKGKALLHGRPVVILHLTDSEGTRMDVCIDAGTSLIVKVTGYISLAGGRTAVLSSEFSRFRKVAGTVFPFRIVYFAEGQKIAEATMNKYLVNAPLPDSLFAP